MEIYEPGSPAEHGAGPVSDPVFVLCNGRSGSTLLRFVLDAHPELACPPETNLPGLCVQLATVWSLIEGAPLSANRGDEPPEIPQAAIAGVRETMDRMVGSYLARRSKKRYCDKSLGTARCAPLLRRVYCPATRGMRT
jgi:protein-tyrosine sulfotransferase